MVRAQLSGGSCPKNLWPLALEYSTYIKNRIPHRTLDGKSPLETADPTISIAMQRKQFRPFSERVYIHAHKFDKLLNQTTKAHVVAFTGTYGIYRVLLANHTITTAKDPTHRNEIEVPQQL